MIAEAPRMVIFQNYYNDQREIMPMIPVVAP
jgi:hypothetical protein